MLAIHKDHKAIKAITAGSVAFAIGLTGAAAYTNSIIKHENLVFSQAQINKKPQPVTGTNDVQQAAAPTSTAAGSQNTGYAGIQPVQSGSSMSGTNNVTPSTPTAVAPTASATPATSTPSSPPVVNQPVTPPATEQPSTPPSTTLPLCTDIGLPNIPIPEVCI